jgi:dTDP-3-amino-3,4,6-trideoxy-alpha-D-glucose transaminase
MAIAPPASSRLHVPFFDLGPSSGVFRDALLEDVAGLLDSGAFTNGPAVRDFEEAFARYVGVHNCVGVASGLDALRLALLAGGLERGEEVVVPAATFAATFEAVTQAGGMPVVADIREIDYCLDPDAVAAAISPRTRVLLPVHLYGQMADLRALTHVASRNTVGIVEDACQAHGATREGRAAGSVGVAAAFSFYPAKNLGAIGDAGALVTDDEGLAETVRSLREHGQARKYHHALEGYTARLDTIQALALLRKLPHLDGWTTERRAIAARYTAEFAGVGDLRLPVVPPGSEPVWHLYVVRTADPAALADFLAERGIGSGRHYPEPPHLSEAYAGLGYRPGAFPVAEALSREALSLPLFPGMTEAQLDAVVHAVKTFFSGL